MRKILVLMDMPLFPYRIYAYNELAKRGYDLDIVSVSKEEYSYDIPFQFKHIRLFPKKIGPFIKLASFSSVKFDDYDIIIVDPNLRMLDYYRLYKSEYWNRLVGWGHHKGRTTGNKLAEWVRFKLFRKFKSLVFYDFNTAQEYIDNGFDPQKIFVANNTQYVDLSKVKLNTVRNSFLYVGRIQERKRIDLAIEAFAELLKKNPSIELKFNIVGGGNDELLKDLIEKLDLIDKVNLCGPIHDEYELAKYFNSAIAYVSPGHVGLGVLHSLAFGVPIITCKNRKHSLELVNCNPDNSFIVDFDMKSLTKAMEQLLDGKTFERMSRKAHDYYKRYCTIDKMVDGIDAGIRNLTNEYIGNGKLLSVYNDEKILYKNFSIYNKNDANKCCLLPHSSIQMIFSHSRLLTRLFRLEPRACIRLAKDRYLISINNRIVYIDLEISDSKIVCEKRIGFSTPLNFCKDDKYVYWGDYGSNHNYEAVCVYRIDEYLNVDLVYSFPNGSIRHIHNIIYDKENERFWILTGDNEKMAGIYIANKSWTSVEPFKIGFQKYRAVVGFPSKNGLIYATDSVEYENYIYYISEDGKEKIIGKINGSCIYGTSIRNKYIFSTTVESHEGSSLKSLFSRKLGDGIKNNEVHLISIDKNSFDFTIIKKLQKDFWPMKLMQYGTFVFPYGQDESSDLWCNVVACKKNDGKNIHFNIDF